MSEGTECHCVLTLQGSPGIPPTHHKLKPVPIGLTLSSPKKVVNKDLFFDVICLIPVLLSLQSVCSRMSLRPVVFQVSGFFAPF